MKKFALLVLTICILLGLAGTALAELSAEEILVKVDKNRYPIESSFKIQCQMYVMRNNQAETRKDMEIYVQNPAKGDAALVKFVYPAEDFGKSILSIGDTNWLYFPSTRKSIQVSAQQSLLGGGDFSNGDVTKIRLSKDYTAKILREDKIFNQEAYVLDLVAKDDKTMYKHIVLWVAKKTYLPLQQEFYAISGKLFKTMVYKKFAKIDGVTRPVEMIMTDAVSPDKKTVLVFKSIKKASLPDSMFTKASLESGN